MAPFRIQLVALGCDTSAHPHGMHIQWEKLRVLTLYSLRRICVLEHVSPPGASEQRRQGQHELAPQARPEGSELGLG